MGLTREENCNQVFNSKLEKELYDNFGLGKEALDKYTLILSDLIDKELLIKTIRDLGKKNLPKIPTTQQIKAIYFRVINEQKQGTNKVYCGVYCYKTRSLVPNGAKIVSCGDMVKVSIANPQNNKIYIWEEETAWKYIWDCVDAWKESEGIKPNSNPKQDESIKAALRSFKESHEYISIAANRPPIAYPKQSESDIYEDNIACAAMPF